MTSFLLYEGKVAVALLVFYLFYRFLLRKETFHRFNRIVLVGTAVLSFVLPLCIITVRKPIPGMPEVYAGPVEVADVAAGPLEAAPLPWWHTALTIIYFTGAAFVLVRLLVSVISILRIVRNGERAYEEDGCRVIITEKDVEPFSWMRYIVMSRKDWEGPHAPILTHERAHIRYGHSAELLLVDVFSSLQWFNPAIWMLRSDLQELHEFEADDAVLRSGVNLRSYQYLLIKKAVGKSGYSVANSFNHSILKNRIKMMSKTKSPLRKGLRALYLLPLLCLGLVLQSKTVYVPEDSESGSAAITGLMPDGSGTLIILRQPWGDEKEITLEEYNQLDEGKIKSLELLKEAAARDKYGEKAANGVIVITLKMPQELNEIVVIRYDDDDGPVPFQLANPDKMPSFQGGDMNDFSRWLNRQIAVPKSCRHSGTMKIKFTVDTNGNVRDVTIAESVCEELDALMLDIVSKSPKWEPARVADGSPVSQTLTIPVKFVVR